MITASTDEIVHADSTCGTFFRSFSCRVLKGEAKIVIGQDPMVMSELVEILCGIELAGEGTLRLFGQDWQTLDQRRWRELMASIGFASGHPALIYNLKVWENLLLPLQIRDTKRIENPSESLEYCVFETFEQAGFNSARTAELLKASPDELNQFEKCVCGLIRCHLSDFGLLIGEGLMEGLEPDEQQHLVRLLNWIGSKRPDSGLFLVHCGNKPTALDGLNAWSPVETLNLEAIS